MKPPEQPALPQNRKDVYAWYGLAHAPNGCPMKDLGEGRLEFHPILVTYLIDDYLKLYKETGTGECLAYAKFLADCAITRADPDWEEMVFTYSPESGLTSVPGTFYSALTQSRYVKAFADLERLCPGEFQDPLRRTFRSLQVPIERGGVLVEKDFGWIIEEYPHAPPFYTLNGWLTAIRYVLGALPDLKRVGIDPEDFLVRNLDAVEHLLPLYDAGFCWNTRYQLTGFTRLKFVTDRDARLDCKALSIEIPGDGRIDSTARPESPGNRWAIYPERREKRLLQYNVLLSLISHPRPNRLHCTLSVRAPCTLSIQLADGDYRPDASGLPTERWREIAVLPLQAGDNRIDLDIPFDGKDLFAYPTNFKKKIGGRLYNGYHFVHVVDLAVMWKLTGRELFRDQARVWLSYIDHWKEMPTLNDPAYSLHSHVYGNDLNDFVERLLCRNINTM